jgi:hypothetical protein
MAGVIWLPLCYDGENTVIICAFVIRDGMTNKNFKKLSYILTSRHIRTY